LTGSSSDGVGGWKQETSNQTNVKTGFILYTWSEGKMKRKVFLSVYVGSPVW